MRNDSRKVIAGTMTVEPAGHVVDVLAGESLIEAAWREDFHWPTLCYGVGKCTACQLEVIDGLDRLSPQTEAERAMLTDFAMRRRRVHPQRLRLACQVRISGDVVVRKPGVRPADPETTRSST
ncbi:2Fe-2S iron-sulfur cluster-binding protein [Nocardioides sp. WS12]|uniref:2Fe-2S iron-sulfur cluster-binding protein n=1 Tax=Nocardioides sp. WS12 TaxID=2486272 RepID=UPI0015FE5552|nr:2Fe-2S iron-sulfur cluster-binding protein [Nocardioides sp. WS12]